MLKSIWGIKVVRLEQSCEITGGMKEWLVR